jgi:large subunit ribosomal protein L15
MRIDQANDGIVKNRKRRRLGRGPGSGQGKTAGRGHNGHKSRSGYSRHPAFQGGDLPMIRRIPKRGFHNRYALTVVSVNVSRLSEEYAAGEEVNPQTLQEKGIVKRIFDVIKILGDGIVDKSLKVSAHRFSESAKEKITAAGGSVTELRVKRTPDERVADLAKQAAGN